MKPPAKQPPKGTYPGTLDAVRELTSKLLKVPKSEVDRKEADYQKQQAKKLKRGPKKK